MRVLGHALVGPKILGPDVSDGERGVELVAVVVALLGVVPVALEDHHFVEDPVGDGLKNFRSLRRSGSAQHVANRVKGLYSALCTRLKL